jgi:hypothetical protein
VSALDEYLRALEALPPDKRAQVVEDAKKATAGHVWVPNPGPQTAAYFSDADELLFGGEAGGGKSDLGIGLALTAHNRSLVLRRTNKEAEKLFDRFEEIIGNNTGKNSQKGWRFEDRIIDIGGCQLEADKQKRKGIAHDLKFFDELVDFSRTQYEFITTWTRSRNPKQRTRIVATTNPPTTPEGMWVVERWAAWLDPKHPNPAKDGELRWYTAGPDGREIEVQGRGPHDINGKQVFAKSRTFIRSKLSDNPDLTQTDDYRATLDALPIELRAAYAEGRFDANLKDQALQAIPTDWIRAAMDRHQEKPAPHVPMCGMGVDASGGGTDPMVIAIRHDGWYAPNIRIPAKEIPSTRAGKHAAGIIVSYRRNQAVVVVDMGGGYGGGIYEALHDNEIKAVPYKGAEGTSQRTKDGQIKFTNIRTQAYWRFREAIDPSQPGGSPIMLPFDPLVLADLAAPTFRMTPSGLALESKEKVCERLGRSTDDGDAIVMAWFAGPTYLTDGAQWASDAEMGRGLGRRPQSIMSGRRQPMTGPR